MAEQLEQSTTPDKTADQSAALCPDYRWQDELGGEVLVPRSATFVGVGGFGSWAALLVALAGTADIVLIDPGSVDEIDLARSPYLPSTIGVPKVEALAAVLKSYRPSLTIELHPVPFDGEVHAEILRGVVFNGISNDDIDRELWRICGARALKCVSGVYAGTKAGTFTSRPRELVIQKDGPVWVGSAAMSAFLAVHSVFVKNLQFLGSIDQLNEAQFRASRSVESMDWMR